MIRIHMLNYYSKKGFSFNVLPKLTITTYSDYKLWIYIGWLFFEVGFEFEKTI